MIGEKIKKLDFMAPQVGLNVGGSDGIKTYFGLMMSIGYLVSISILGSVIVQSFFDTTEPRISQETSESGEYPVIDFMDNNLFPVSYVYYNDIFPIPAAMVPKYFTIKFVKYAFNSYFDQNGQPQVNGSVNFMDVIPCSELKQNQSLYKYYEIYKETKFFKQNSDALGLCIKLDPELLKVGGGGADTSVELLTYAFYPCSLSSGCATKEEMNNVGIVYSFPSTSMNLSSKSDPVKSYLNADNFVYVNTAQRQKFQSKLSVTEIYDDPGTYFPVTLESNFSSVDRMLTTTRYRNDSNVQCTQLQLLSDQCSSYFLFDYMSSGKKIKLLRQYKGIVETISDIGGINSIVFLLFLWSNYLYISFIQKKLMVHRVFDFFNEKLFTTTERRSCLARMMDICRCRCIFRKKKDSDVFAKDSPELRRKPSIVSKHDPRALDPVVVSNLQDQAYNMIEKSLDVITLVKEINNLKLLTHFLLRDYHLKLAPLITLSLQCSKSDVKLMEQDSLTENGSPKRLKKSMTTDEYASLGFKKMNFQEALMNLKENKVKKTEKRGNPEDFELKENSGQLKGSSSIESSIDRFCYDSLAKGKFVFSELLKISITAGLEYSPSYEMENSVKIVDSNNRISIDDGGTNKNSMSPFHNISDGILDVRKPETSQMMPAGMMNKIKRGMKSSMKKKIIV